MNTALVSEKLDSLNVGTVSMDSINNKQFFVIIGAHHSS